MTIQVVAGRTRPELLVNVKNRDKTVPDVTSWTAKLQGKSADLPATSIDVAGAIVAPATNGQFKWIGLGAIVAPATLGAKPSATFTLRVFVTDAAGKTDDTDSFEIEWLAPLI